MAETSGQYVKLPPGWDCKYDQSTGNCYYVNYFTKAMQLEDPRLRYRPLQNERCSSESIAMAPMQGSPYHVYPSNNYPAVRAFQGPIGSQMGPISSSPLLSTRSNLEMSPLPVSRLAGTSRRSTIQETSFSNHNDTDAIVTKIQNMFPTASENHIRLLLKRYYNREAVVISALQVEKHPVTMPGPFVTPPAQRHLFHSNSAVSMTPPTRRLELASTSRVRGLSSGFGGSTSRTASPLPVHAAGGRFGSVKSVNSGGADAAGAAGGAHGLHYGPMPPFYHGSPRFGDQMRSSPKPHSSPKMKLRYMKTIFPKADETLLLDVLANADNNVQTASEKLISMGYVKRDFVPPKATNRPELDAEGNPKKPSDEKVIPLRPKEYSAAEKEEMKTRLKQKYNKIADRIILMALESVSYAEDRASQILQIVREEDEARERENNELLLEVQPHISDAATTTTDGVKVPPGRAQGDNNSNNRNTPSKSEQQHQLPSINVITPSTTTTKRILDFESSNHSTESLKPSNEPKALFSSSLSSSPSSSQLFERITTKSILERSNEVGSSRIQKLQKSSCTQSPDTILESLRSSRSRYKTNSLKSSRGSTEEEVNFQQQSTEFKSMLGRLTAMGHNTELANGADDSLLLADYVTWNGANPSISLGQKQLAAGADAALLSERSCVAAGRNPELCKGPKPGLAKGSIYAQLAAAVANIKCN